MLGLPDGITTCLFDLDGVLTQTAKVHAAAWKQTFDEYLHERADRGDEEFKEFDKVADYDEYVDGKPRYDGVQSFLAVARDRPPVGRPDDPPDKETVCGIGNRKNDLVLKLIKEQGVEAYDGSVRYVKAVRDAGLHRAVVSSSANCKDVLVAAGIEDLFEARIDGIVADQQHLKGKPAPDTFLAGAKALGVPPAQATVFEDALAGVQAGRAGNFGYVVGVDRVGQADALRAHGADVVVKDLAELLEQVVIEHPAFPVEPWAVRETELHLDTLAQAESVFALSNGHIGLRGNLDEGEPYGLPGTYLGGFYEVRPLPYAEAGYGYPEDGQTVVNVTNGKIIRLLVEDEPFDVRYGVLRHHERVLDLRAGVLRRTAEWVSPTGREVRVSSTRLVSFTQRAVVAIEYVVEAIGDSFPVVVLSELIANESGPAQSHDPRAAAALAEALESEYYDSRGNGAILVHHTKQSGLRVAAAMDHLVEGPDGTSTEIEAYPDLARFLVTADIAPDKPLRILKLAAYGWSAERSVPALRDQVAAARAGARHAGWEGLLADQRQYLDRFWERSDVELEGDAELQQAIRFGLFHTLQAGARGEQRAIAAKGLTGPGYDGHTFWDTEAFVLPVLTYTAPRGGADALRWRHSTLDLARERARTLGSEGGGVSVADDPGPGVLELLAGGHGRLSHQRRHRRRRHPLPGGHRRPATSKARWGSSCWSRPHVCGARSATTTPTAISASTG